MGVTIEGQVGPRYVTDGAETEVRLTRSGGVVTADGHARFFEPASRGLVFAGGTALAGTTIVAGNVAPPAAAAATVLSVYNPVGSGVTVEILRAFLQHVSGTPGAGAWAWCVSFGSTAVTAVQNNFNVTGATGQQSNGNGAPRAKIFTQTALTGGSAQLNYRTIMNQFAGALAATTPNLSWIDPTDGEIVLPPGSIATLAPPAAGTTHIVAASIVWLEIPFV